MKKVCRTILERALTTKETMNSGEETYLYCDLLAFTLALPFLSFLFVFSLNSGTIAVSDRTTGYYGKRNAL